MDSDYGIPWGELAKEGGFDNRLENDGLARELFLYRYPEWREQFNTGSESDHMKRAIRLYSALPGVNFFWHDWVDVLIEDWCNSDVSCIWGPSSIGKSAVLALICLMDFLADPFNTSYLVITNIMDKHNDRFWGNLMGWYGKLPEQWKVGKDLGKPLGLFTQRSTGADEVKVKSGPDRGFLCRAMAKGEAIEKVKEVVGTHAARNRLIVDEPQSCNLAILDIGKNFGASGHYKEKLMGNPTTWDDALGKASDPATVERSDCSQRGVNKWENKRIRRGVPSVTVVLDGRDIPWYDNDPDGVPLLHTSEVKQVVDKIAAEIPLSQSEFTYSVGRIQPMGTTATMCF